MRNLKRALSLALASVMLLGMMVVGTSAASYPDVDGEKNVEAISVLNAVGAMIGDENGNFNPDKNVTRNEMAAVVARLLLGPDAEDYAGTVPFTDVPDWAVKYVAACYDNGIVNGVSETEYNGDGTITAEQAATMMLRALGYENITDTGADWAKRAVAKANEINLFKGVTGNTTATLTRNDVAQLSLNTLKATCVKTEVTGTTGTIVSGDVNVTLNGEIKYTEVESSEDWADKIDDTAGVASGKKTVQLGEKLYEGKLELIPDDDDSNPTDDLGRPASQWVYDGGDPIYTVTKKAGYTVTLKETPEDMDALLKLAKKGLKENSATITLNGADEKSQNTPYDVDDLGAGDVVEMYLTSGEVTAIYVTRYVLDQITDVDDDVKDDDAEDGVSCYVDFDDFGNNINNTDIPGFDADTYVEDAYVALLINDEGDIVDSYIPKIVESSIDTVKDVDGKKPAEITIGKDKYTVATAYAAPGDGVAMDENNKLPVSQGDENTYALYLDKNGYILGITEVEVETTSIDDVYYLDTVWAETGKMNSKSYYAQLVALDGTVSEVELEQMNHKLNANDDTEETDLDGYVSASNGAAENDNEPAPTFESLRGALVTISDKKVVDSQEDTVTSKKGDKKYNLTAWGGDDDWTTDDLTVQGFALKKDDRNLGDTDYRLNKDTVYLFLEESGKNLAITRYVGGVKFEKTITGGCVIADKSNGLAKYVVIAAANTSLDSDFSSDLIFIKSASKVKGKGYYSQEVYLPDGAKETWKIDAGEYGNGTPAQGFYAYSENDDGYYDLDAADEMTVAATNEDAQNPVMDWQKDKPAGVLTATVDDSKALFEGMLTVKAELTPVNNPSNQAEEGEEAEDTTIPVKDITVDGAAFMDLHNTKGAGQYDKAVKSLKALLDLMKTSNQKATSATLYMSVTEDGAVSIFVTSVTAVPADDDNNGGNQEGPGEEPGDEETSTKPTVSATKKYAGDSDFAAISGDGLIVVSDAQNNEATITVTAPTGSAENDQVKVTVTPAQGTTIKNGGATAEVTFKCGNDNETWAADGGNDANKVTISITADESEVVYTISVTTAEE